MPKIPCSVPLLTLNSAEHLAECLASLKDFEDVYLVDGNSTDGTQAIAKQFGVRVEKQVETDEPNVRIKDFSAMRIRAISMAKCDWIFDFDSDEYTTLALVSEIRETIEKAQDEKTAYNIQKKNVFGKRVVEYAYGYPSYYLRLYNKKSGIVFSTAKIVHEEMYVPKGIKIQNMEGSIYSYGPATFKEAIGKDNHYLSIVRKKMFPEVPNRRTTRLVDFLGALKNVGRASHYVYCTIGVYLSHGLTKSTPFLEVFRFVRYHLIISWYRFKHAFI